MNVHPRARTSSFRRGFFAVVAGAVLVAACGWDPSRPFDREAPQVNQALRQYDAGEAGSAADLLQDYLATGACKEGNIGTPLRVRERSNGSFDLGLSLFKLAETYGHRFGDEENDAGFLDPSLKGLRAAQVDCALRIVRAVAEDSSQSIALRARARYLEGNLLFLNAAYKEAVTAYDIALEFAPGMGDAGPIGSGHDAGEVVYIADPLGRDAAWNRAVALRRIEEKKDAGTPDAGPPGDGGGDQSGDSGSNSPDSGGGGDAGKPKDDKDKDKKDAGDENKPKNEPPKKEPDAGPPPPPPPSRQSQDERMLDQLENAPTVQQAAAQKGRRIPGMVDK